MPHPNELFKFARITLGNPNQPHKLFNLSVVRLIGVRGRKNSPTPQFNFLNFTNKPS
jgi:hypothetical protein